MAPMARTIAIPHQIGDVDLGAEHLQLYRADESQDETDQQADEGDDGQRVGTAFLEDEHHVGATEPCPAGEKADKGNECLSYEGRHVEQRLPEIRDRGANTFEKRVAGSSPTGTRPFRDGSGKGKESVNA